PSGIFGSARLGAAVLSGALALSACGSGAGAESSTVDVVASFYPLAYVAEQVGGGHVAVTNLTQPGIEPHDLQLKPRQSGEVHDADLVVFESGFQAAVDDAVTQADLSAQRRCGGAERVKLSGAIEHGRSQGGDIGLDPHIWLDPQNLVSITKAVRDHRIEVDKTHSEDYRRNAHRLIGELERLDRQFT